MGYFILFSQQYTLLRMQQREQLHVPGPDHLRQGNRDEVSGYSQLRGWGPLRRAQGVFLQENRPNQFVPVLFTRYLYKHCAKLFIIKVI